jgi:hypothetical protein
VPPPPSGPETDARSWCIVLSSIGGGRTWRRFPP